MASNWVNMIFGVLGRHLGTKLKPDPEVIKDFSSFVE
jgi:hypothetical protein